MTLRQINKENFAEALDETLDECLAQLDKTTHDGPLMQDLAIAVQALRGIKLELEGKTPQRAKGLRSGLFIRYALDANDHLTMDKLLKEKVVRLEDVYKRL